MSVSDQDFNLFETNGTLNESPRSPPQSPSGQAPPPKDSTSSPPPNAAPPPPSPSGGSASEPPSSSSESNAPPPDQSPPAPPPDNSSSSLPPPPPPNTIFSPPSSRSNGPTSSPSSDNPPPPLQSPPTPTPTPPPPPPPPPTQLFPPPSSGDLAVLTPPPPPISPSQGPNPPSEISPPSVQTPNTSPGVSSPLSPQFPFSPPPPVVENPPLSPPPQVENPSSPGTPAGFMPPPPSEESATNQSLPPVTPDKPSTLTPNGRPSDRPSPPTPPKDSDSSSLTPSSKDSSHSGGSFGLGAAVGVTMALLVIAVILIYLKKRRKKSESLAVQCKPPISYSIRSDGYYYRHANSAGNSAMFNSQYNSHPPSFPSATGTFGSHGDRMSYSGPPELVGLGNSKSYFTYEEIAEMTHGFSQQNLLGEGGFGCVYKGWLIDGREVAVKQLKAGSGQGEREFRAEVEIISRVHHRHLVSLVGYCISDHHRSLVYEFVPNKTLEHHLHGRGLPVMEWNKRLKIAIGAARGLAYLHEDCHPRIIHRDIKTANILLDDTFEAQVADFGLAKLSNDTNTHVSTRVMGTFGYMAPEYASSGKLTDRSDVFSFGVVLLELITGRKSVDQSQPLGEESLVEWARPHLNHALESGDFEGLVDPRLDNNYVKGEMFRMMEAAAACVRHSAPKRPRMVQVLRALDSDGELSDLSNGVKFGQSTVFDSGQYSADIQQFRRMAFGSGSYISERSYTEEYASSSATHSGEYLSNEEAIYKPLNSGRQNSREYRSSHEFASHATNRHGNERNINGSYQYNVRGFH